MHNRRCLQFIFFRLNWLNLATSNCKANYVNLISVCILARHFILLRPCVAFLFLSLCVFIALDVQSICVCVWCGVCTHENSPHSGRMSKMECTRATKYSYERKRRHTNTQALKNLPYAIKCLKEFLAVALPCNVIWRSTQLHIGFRSGKPFSFSGGCRTFFFPLLNSLFASFFLRTDKCFSPQFAYSLVRLFTHPVLNRCVYSLCMWIEWANERMITY